MCNEFKNDMTLEEAEARCVELADKYESARRYADELRRKRDEEKRTQLAAEKAKRQEEIDTAMEHLNCLSNEFFKDYGYHYISRKYSTNKLFDFFVF